MNKYIKSGIILTIILLASVYFIVPLFSSKLISTDKVALSKLSTKTAEVSSPVEEYTHIATPKPLKAIYMSACYAGSKTLREGLAKLIDDTELNAIIIDVKDYSGKISFIPNDDWQDYLSDKCSAKDMKDFIKNLHDRYIYVIARITSFQDPYYTKLHPSEAVKQNSDKSKLWQDRKGINYLDPGSQVARDHLVKLAEDSYNAGFDEINFDYIRFPSDGNMKDIYFPYSEGKNKAVVMEDVFKYLHDKLSPKGIVISADLFGMVTTNTDDLNIGQVLERALPYFDYIAPMVYPSHYPSNFNGWKDPNKVPYELIKFVMDAAVRRTVATTSLVQNFTGTYIASTTPKMYTKESYDAQKMRPWIQDFDYGGTYDIKEVRAQIKATYDSGLTSWMLWAPSNKYTVGALER
jgi:hypothetical protein